MHRAFWSIAPLSAATVSVYVVVGPLVATRSGSLGVDAGGPSRPEMGSSSLLASQGPRIIVLVLIPILLAALPLLASRRSYRRMLGSIAVILLLAFTLVSGMSIGMFYLPTLVILALTLLIESSTPSHGLPRSHIQ